MVLNTSTIWKLSWPLTRLTENTDFKSNPFSCFAHNLSLSSNFGTNWPALILKECLTCWDRGERHQIVWEERSTQPCTAHFTFSITIWPLSLSSNFGTNWQALILEVCFTCWDKEEHHQIVWGERSKQPCTAHFTFSITIWPLSLSFNFGTHIMTLAETESYEGSFLRATRKQHVFTILAWKLFCQIFGAETGFQFQAWYCNFYSCPGKIMAFYPQTISKMHHRRRSKLQSYWNILLKMVILVLMVMVTKRVMVTMLIMAMTMMIPW